MNSRQVTPALEEAARRLLEHEANGPADPAGLAEAEERAFRKLDQHLSELVGSTGLDALLRRALALAKMDHPILNDVAPARGGILLRLQNVAAAHDPAAVTAALVAIPAQFLLLLTTLVGEDLTLRLVLRVWPDLSLSFPHTGAKEEGST